MTTKKRLAGEIGTVLLCWHCDFSTGLRGNDRCPKCGGTGKVFWVNGYAFPYTPEGEKRAEAYLAQNPVDQ